MRAFHDWVQLTKFRIQALSTTAALICAWIAGDGELPLLRALHLVVGLSLTSSAAAILNQVLEVEVDARMRRTAARPLPTGRVALRTALPVGLGCAGVGVAWLAWFLDPMAAWMALVMVVSYVFVYTPLKRLTPFNTLIGAFPGAMPLLVGYAAAGRGLDLRAGILFLILFLWQFPHFFAIAWLHRDDYARGGLRMLTGVDPHGAAGARQGAVWAVALLPASLLPVLLDFAGALYLWGALALSLVFLATAVLFALERTTAHARLVLRTSIVYLPLLFALLAIDFARSLPS